MCLLDLKLRNSIEYSINKLYENKPIFNNHDFFDADFLWRQKTSFKKARSDC